MKVLGLIAAGLLVATGAHAELQDPNRIFTSVTVDDIQALYSELGFPLTVVDDGADQKTLSGQFNQNSPFFVGLGDCKSGACDVIIIFSLVGGEAPPLEFVNKFNSEVAIGRVAVMPIEQHPTAVAHDFVTRGGITRRSLALQTVLFTTLLQDYLKQHSNVMPGWRSSSAAPSGTSAFADLGAQVEPGDGWKMPPDFLSAAKRARPNGAILLPEKN